MMLVDAIESAVSEHAVYFLVTAYMESLHHFQSSLRIPKAVIALPLGGMEDLAGRAQALREIDNASAGVAGEALAILDCALARLQALARAPSAGIDALTAARRAAA
jgi:hypothetical protein